MGRRARVATLMQIRVGCRTGPASLRSQEPAALFRKAAARPRQATSFLFRSTYDSVSLALSAPRLTLLSPEAPFPGIAGRAVLSHAKTPPKETLDGAEFRLTERLVDGRRIELLTSALRTRRSPS